VFTKRIEDYLETIFNLTETKGQARINDIAENLHVRPPSATEMIQKLAMKALVNREGYGTIHLTRNGERIAKNVKKRREVIAKLLRIILVPEEVAYRDACVMEHKLDSKTIEQLEKFVNFVNNARVQPRWIKHFKEYCETGKYPLK
jgi:DtxR family Mn-dependent transcriptional regulator